MDKLFEYITNGTLELIGIMDQVVEMKMPHEDYELDERIGRGRTGTHKGLFRVSKMGLRVNGRTLVRASLVPIGEKES